MPLRTKVPKAATIPSSASPENPAPWGEDPIDIGRGARYLNGMNLLIIMLVLLLVFGGGGFFFGGPVIGGSGIGLILLICLVIYFMGGFRGSRG